ncbi:MAG: hypothetical protein KKD39_06195 [Candidatus Altiarchaeota archaeon]|nr:hypothetical protein [Candidatus Altiarchaeota archaeon]
MKAEIEPRKAILNAALMGFIFGIVGAIPILWIPNICCLWILAGGFLSVYLVGKSKKSIELADGFIIGAIFGISYTVFNEVAYYIIVAIMAVFSIGPSNIPNTTGGLAKGIVKMLFLALVNLVVSFFAGGFGGLAYVVSSNPSETDKHSISRRKI